MCGTKALQWIVRYESLERLAFPHWAQKRLVAAFSAMQLGQRT